MSVRSVNGISSPKSCARVPQSPTLTAWRARSPVECIAMGVVASLSELVGILTPMYRARANDEDAFGSASHAIGRALKVLIKPSASQAAVDISMSLVLLHALQGDAAARVLVVFALKRSSAPARLVEAWRQWRLEAVVSNPGGATDGVGNALQ